MRFLDVNVIGARLIEPSPHEDERGRFMRVWCTREFSENGVDFLPLQANMGLSRSRGTTRGMHFQDCQAPEAKLVRCTRGSIFDVVLDLRRASPSFGQWYGAELTPDNGRMLYVPQHCAHGYQTLEDDTEMLYLTSALYCREAAKGVRFDDPAFGIRWPLPSAVVSEQDRAWPLVER